MSTVASDVFLTVISVAKSKVELELAGVTFFSWACTSIELCEKALIEIKKSESENESKSEFSYRYVIYIKYKHYVSSKANLSSSRLCYLNT